MFLVCFSLLWVFLASRVNSVLVAGLLVSSLLVVGFSLPSMTVLCQPLGPLVSSLPVMDLSLLAVEVSCCSRCSAGAALMF